MGSNRAIDLSDPKVGQTWSVAAGPGGRAYTITIERFETIDGRARAFGKTGHGKPASIDAQTLRLGRRNAKLIAGPGYRPLPPEAVKPIKGSRFLADTQVEQRKASECVREFKPRGVPKGGLSDFDITVRDLVRARTMTRATIAQQLGVAQSRVDAAWQRVLNHEALEAAKAS